MFIKKSKYPKMMDKYPLLFCMKNRPATETCMCWGIEAGERLV